ncbi:hypothetical protein K8F61_05650 [Microbacterium resistens]|uniref:3-methyladenine DNA glycosylase n=1 Tax=Microbacterium resistens TaxID=156977 RepID=A0ABY3RUE3_9MICO|nr:hypothetical protein [Microbacterium resistens]UGS27669.1 hypothetical protein K8F61_05650 [Microbacterium resistens]
MTPHTPRGRSATATSPAVPAVRWATPALSRTRETLQPAGERLWRVLDERGTIRGHLRVAPDPLGVRYRAERLHLATGAFRLVGEFWSPDDAVAALRF